MSNGWASRPYGSPVVSRCLRKNLELLVADIAALSPAPEIALTTNGIGLAARAEKLAAAGLKRINISLDTLDPQHLCRAGPSATAAQTYWPESLPHGRPG